MPDSSDPREPRNDVAARSESVSAEARFVRRLLVIAAFVLLAVVVWRLSLILVLAFGATLLSLVLRGVAAKIARIFSIGERTALAAVVAVLFALLGLVGWRFGAQIAAQFEELAERLPEISTRLLTQLGGHPLGLYVLQQVQGVSLTGATGIAAAGLARVATIASHGLGYSALMLFAGIYIAAQPQLYRRGVLRLVPMSRRDRASVFLDVAAAKLQRWLMGQLVVMTVVGVLIALGLWLLGVRAAFALGLIDGLLTFVPIVGPTLASIPALLMALSQGPMLAVYTLVLFLGVHMVEGNLVTPVVQSHAVSLPPVLTLFAALSFGLLLGPLAVLFAAPLAVLMLVAFRMLYIEDVLGERITGAD